MEKHIIVAADEHGCIGKNNEMPWHYPSDLKWFKSITTGHTVVMGRKTYESIGRLLPNRRNVIITRKNNLGYLKTSGLTEAAVVQDWSTCSHLVDRPSLQKCFVIGGSQIYEQALKNWDVKSIYLTQVPGNYDGDTYFPIWPLSAYGWKVAENFDVFPQDGLKFFRFEKK